MNRIVPFVLAALLLPWTPLRAADPPRAGDAASPPPPNTRSGREIYERFRAGLADKTCSTSSTARWRAHFAHAPGRLASRDDDLMPLFGYVVDALRDAGLPTEYALIPFVESGYRPGARSKAGPAGLWQMIAITARNQKVPMRGGYDGRLSPVDATRGAVRYLKTLHFMFGGDWRLAVMAYNAGEYRVLGALKRSGRTFQNARPESLPGLPEITHSYVRKLQTLSCLMDSADDREAWLAAIDRPVPYLRAQPLPAGQSLDAFASRNGLNAAQLRRLNPALAASAVSGMPVLAAGPAPTPAIATGAATATATIAAVPPPVEPLGPVVDAETPLDAAPSPPVALPIASATSRAEVATDTTREHVVARGDNPWTIARRHRLRVADLLAFNGLAAGARLRPGQVLRLQAPTTR